MIYPHCKIIEANFIYFFYSFIVGLLTKAIRIWSEK